MMPAASVSLFNVFNPNKAPRGCKIRSDNSRYFRPFTDEGCLSDLWYRCVKDAQSRGDEVRDNLLYIGLTLERHHAGKISTFVYCLDAHSSFKVGWSNNPTRREKELRYLTRGRENATGMVFTASGDMGTEHVIHCTLKEFELGGEWFSKSERSVSLVRAMFARLPNFTEYDAAQIWGTK